MRVHLLHLTIVLVAALVGDLYAQQPGPAAESARRDFPVPANVEVRRDIVYAEYGPRRMKLDVYLPPNAGARANRAGVLVVRGGGWRTGDKEFFGFIAGQLAKEGFVAASVEYRTSAEATFPAAVYDVKAAVRWLRAHAGMYGVDPSAIGAIGGSAGAHLVALLATSSGVKDLEGNGGNALVSSQVQAVVAMACVCVIDAREAQASETVRDFLGSTEARTAQAASPVTYVSSRSAPLLLLHSPTDPVVPFEQSVEIEKRYRRAGAQVTLIKIDAPETHAFWNQTAYFPQTITRASEFLRRHLDQRSTTRP
jgi:acetyl esterase/lipase